jgi:hypothetical protein
MNQDLSPVRTNCQFIFAARIRTCKSSIHVARQSARNVSARTCGANLHFQRMNLSRFVKNFNTIVGGIFVMSTIWRIEACESFRRARRINSSKCSLGAFLVPPRNCRFRSRSLWFASSTNMPLQEDQRPRQVSCGSRWLTSLARGVGGQDLPRDLTKRIARSPHVGIARKTRGQQLIWKNGDEFEIEHHRGYVWKT